MPHDVMHARMLKARDEHDALQRQAQLAEAEAKGKPSPTTVMSIETAEGLVKAHEYAEDEQIGLKLTGGYSDAVQVLRYSGGQVVIDPRHDQVLKSRDPKVHTGTLTGWTVQAGRLIRLSEAAG